MSFDKEDENSISSTATAKLRLGGRPRTNLGSSPDLKKREDLKRLVKQNTKCEHSAIYSQITFICRRLAIAYEGTRITTEQAMNLIFEAHEQLSHKGLPRDVVAEQLHKRLDKMENNNKSLFGIVMANTNSSVHIRGKENKAFEEESAIDKSDEEQQIHSDGDRYSESYWADVI